MYKSNSLKYYYLYFKESFLFNCIIYLSFYKSETSLNFSYFVRQDFVKIQNFDGYDVIMTY